MWVAILVGHADPRFPVEDIAGVLTTRKLHHLTPRLSSTPPRLSAPLKILDNFYTSPVWRKFIAQVIAERGRRCESCGREYDDDGQAVRLIGDHIVERSDGGADLDPSNIQLLCVRMAADGTGGCANRKTAEARRARMQGKAGEGKR